MQNANDMAYLYTLTYSPCLFWETYAKEIKMLSFHGWEDEALSASLYTFNCE